MQVICVECFDFANSAAPDEILEAVWSQVHGSLRWEPRESLSGFAFGARATVWVASDLSFVVDASEGHSVAFPADWRYVRFTRRVFEFLVSRLRFVSDEHAFVLAELYELLTAAHRVGVVDDTLFDPDKWVAQDEYDKFNPFERAEEIAWALEVSARNPLGEQESLKSQSDVCTPASTPQPFTSQPEPASSPAPAFSRPRKEPHVPKRNLLFSD